MPWETTDGTAGPRVASFEPLTPSPRPDLIDVETVAVLGRGWPSHTISDERFEAAVVYPERLEFERVATLRLMRRAYLLRANATPYDACYVALAEALGSGSRSTLPGSSPDGLCGEQATYGKQPGGHERPAPDQGPGGSGQSVGQRAVLPARRQPWAPVGDTDVGTTVRMTARVPRHCALVPRLPGHHRRQASRPGQGSGCLLSHAVAARTLITVVAEESGQPGPTTDVVVPAMPTGPARPLRLR